MIIHLTQPVCDSPIFERILKLWERRAEEVSGAEVVVHRAEPYVNHGELLNRIWRKMLKGPVEDRVISEIDFIPELGCVKNLLAVTGNPSISGAMPKKVWMGCYEKDGSIGPFTYRDDESTLSAPWLIVLPSRIFSSPNLPPENWLDHFPGYDEPALKAYTLGVESGIFTEESFLWIKADNSPAPLHGVRYPGFGIHAFCGRHYADPPESRLPDLLYTVREHLAEIDKILLSYDA